MRPGRSQRLIILSTYRKYRPAYPGHRCKTDGNGGVILTSPVFDLRFERLSIALAPLLGGDRSCSGRGEDRVRRWRAAPQACSVPVSHGAPRTTALGADEASADGPSIGIAQTRDFLPEELGRRAQCRRPHAVRVAMSDAGIVILRDVHFVQIKCPLLTSAPGARFGRRRAAQRASMAYRAALGARGDRALGDITAISRSSWAKLAPVLSMASTSAGIDLMHNVVIVARQFELSPVPRLIGRSDSRRHRCRAPDRGAPSVGPRFRDFSDPRFAIVCVKIFAKAEASPDGTVRGVRHFMLEIPTSGYPASAAAVSGSIAGSRHQRDLCVRRCANLRGRRAADVAVIAR